MRKIVLILSLLLTLTVNLFSQDTNIIKYLPLQVGNVWVYYYFNSALQGNSSGYQRFEITGTTTHISKTFYVYSTVTRPIQGTYICAHPLFVINKHIRIDSLTGKVMGWEFCNPISQEYTLDSLYSRLNDFVRDCRGAYDGKRCSDTSIQNIFGLSKQSKQFSVLYSEGGASWRYVKEIGLSRLNKSDAGDYNCYTMLIGCVINGTLYGDTTFMTTGINLISTEIPNHFSLSQNYPNPFNPNSKIQFALPKSSFAKIVVYDMIGKEIETVVNEQLSAGTYEVDFDGSEFSSGVYYYQLTAGDYTETKKMVLMK